jgi:hypothetical protein
LRDARRTSSQFGNSLANIFLFAMILLVGCEREVIVPQHLRGEWKTTAPEYADRSMKFSEHAVIYGIGNGAEVSHLIEKIDDEREADGTVYTFYYRDAEGQRETLVVLYRLAFGGTLQIKNSKVIWKKIDAGQAG